MADDGTASGLAADYATLAKPGKNDRDLFSLHLGNILTTSVGTSAASNVSTTFHTVDGQDVCRVHVQPCGHPADAEVIIDVKGQYEKQVKFFARILNGTRELSGDERQRYIASHWSSAG